MVGWVRRGDAAGRTGNADAREASVEMGGSLGAADGTIAVKEYARALAAV